MSRRRSLLALAVALVAVLLPAAAAFADTASMTVTDASGKDDPVAGVGRTFKITGNVPTQKRLFVKYRATGGAACAPSPRTDSGTYFSSSGPHNGDFTWTDSRVWQTPGTFVFCFWLADNDEATATPITQQITFRNPTGTISGTVNPPTPAVDQETTLTVTGASEASMKVYAKIRPAGGAPCAAAFQGDTGETLMQNREVDGAFSTSTTVKRDTPGQYLICLWLGRSYDDTAPIAGPQPVTFTVPAPPPPCVVPALAPGTPLAAVQTQLATASCAVGRRSYVASRRYARGSLVKLKVASGTSLANGSRVDLVLSSGAPCVVPRAVRGMKLSTARAKLARSGCRAGAVKRVRSKRKRGTVVSFAPGSGARLSPRATVAIRVSRGR